MLHISMYLHATLYILHITIIYKYCTFFLIHLPFSVRFLNPFQTFMAGANRWTVCIPKAPGAPQNPFQSNPFHPRSPVARPELQCCRPANPDVLQIGKRHNQQGKHQRGAPKPFIETKPRRIHMNPELGEQQG